MKTFLPLLFLLLSLPLHAQEGEVPSQRFSVATTSFWSNWFVQASVAATSFHAAEADGISVPTELYKGFRTNGSLSLSLGKWFTPGIGLRSRVNGIWGRTAVTEDKDKNASKYWTLSEQLLLNFSNLFCGYNTTRRWNFIPYLSAGFGRSMTYNTYAMGLGAGILNQWRLTPRLAVTLDASLLAFEPDFDGYGITIAKPGLPGKDRLVSLEVGIGYSLGSGEFHPVPDINALKTLTESQIDALNAMIADQQAENDRLRAVIAGQQNK